MVSKLYIGPDLVIDKAKFDEVLERLNKLPHRKRVSEIFGIPVFTDDTLPESTFAMVDNDGVHHWYKIDEKGELHPLKLDTNSD